jgi:hypothetical protein
MSPWWRRITWRPGLVLNAVVLWNTRYTDAACLLPLGDHHLNVDGRYTLTPPASTGPPVPA